MHEPGWRAQTQAQGCKPTSRSLLYSHTPATPPPDSPGQAAASAMHPPPSAVAILPSPATALPQTWKCGLRRWASEPTAPGARPTQPAELAVTGCRNLSMACRAATPAPVTEDTGKMGMVRLVLCCPAPLTRAIA